MGVEVTVKALALMGLTPSPREAHILISLDAHRILLLGGGSISPASGPQQFNDMYLLDLKEGKWSYIEGKGEKPSPRTGQTATLLDDGRVLVFGGSSMTDGYMDDVYVLDTKEWIWSHPQMKGKIPSARDKHTACLVGRSLYVFGGFGPSNVEENGDMNQEVEEMNEDNDEGVNGDGSDENGNGNADEGDDDAISEDGADEDEILDGGEEDEEDGLSMSFTWFNDLHVLDVIDMEWKELEATGVKPTPRAAHASFIANYSKENESGDVRAKMYVFGGRDHVGRTNDLYTLDIKSLEWKKEISKAPPARSFHVMLPLPGSKVAVCYGGMGANGEMFSGLELMDLQTLEWTSPKSSNGFWPPLRGATSMTSTLSQEEPKLIIFGGSQSVEDKETIYYNDAYVAQLSVASC